MTQEQHQKYRKLKQKFLNDEDFHEFLIMLGADYELTGNGDRYKWIMRMLHNETIEVKKER